MKIAREGYLYFAALFLLAFASYWVFKPGALLFGGLAVFVAFFFRDPTRHAPEGDHLLVSPADGKVVYAGASNEEDDSELKIAIFLSILNVHINRVPMSGQIKDIRHRAGQFLPAYNPAASSKNEQTEIIIEAGGLEIRVRQIVGVIARRIICRLQKDQSVQRGQRYGLMQFGSRMEILLPPDFELKVQVGEHVRGGESVIAERLSTR